MFLPGDVAASLDSEVLRTYDPAESVGSRLGFSEHETLVVSDELIIAVAALGPTIPSCAGFTYTYLYVLTKDGTGWAIDGDWWTR